MVEGPLGRNIRLVDDNKTVLVVMGIDGPDPPRDIRMSLEPSVKQSLDSKASKGGNNFIEDVNLSIQENVDSKTRETFGGATLHVQQYEVQTSLEEITQKTVNAIHNDVVEEVDKLGFNIVGTETTVV